MLLREFEDFRSARRQPPVQKPPKKRGKSKSKIRVIVGDLHGMRLCRPAVDAFLHDLKALNPEEILLGGDMIDAGGWISKHQPVGFQAAADYSYAEDIEATNWFLDEVQARAPHAVIKFVSGNHEDKVERLITDMTMVHTRDMEFMMSTWSPKALLQLKERGIEYYDRHDIHEEGLPPGWIRWGKLCHTHELGGGKNAARGALLTSAANVCFHHTHTFDEAAINFPGVGLVKAYNPGCLCELQPVWRHSNPTSWNHGYLVAFIEPNDEFLCIHVPISEGRSFAGTMLDKLKK